MNYYFTSTLILVNSTLVMAVEITEPGVMIRPAAWQEGTGASYVAPNFFSKLKPVMWPTDGWHRFIFLDNMANVSAVIAPAKKIPLFLKWIAAEVQQSENLTTETQNLSEIGKEVDHGLYVRLPGVNFPNGEIPLYRFLNGTSRISPKLDYRYELVHSGQAFAFTVQNGFKGRDGKPYGEGAQYTIEYDGNRYEYSLPGYGWDSRINAIADLDGDGKPDFLISLGGGGENLILSSQARPGKNSPSASLYANGC